MGSFQERISLRGLLMWLGILGLLILLAATLLVGLQTYEVTSTTDRVVDIYEPAAEDASTLALSNSEMDRGVSLYALSQEEEDLVPYVNGERRSALALESLDRLLGSDRNVGPLIDDVKDARGRWLEEVTRPAIKDVRSDKSSAAERRITGEEGQQLFDELVTATFTLSHQIDEVRSSDFRDLVELTDRLSWAVGVTVLALIAAVITAMMIMFRWVLAPLNDIRRQIRDVARQGNHDQPILPTGPRELAAVGSDAETMRRQLVEEIDEARSARQALEHSAPLVTAIRRELSMATDPLVAGVTVHGEVQPAEGVLAGDWWDCVAMPTGEVALIVTDISGHGPEAGIAAMRLKHLLAQSLASGAGPDEALALAARTFADDESRFATVVVVCVNPGNGDIRWSNGGHHPPILLSSDGEIQELGRTGPLLSWIGGPWTIERTTMARQDYLLSFSDGLVESHDAAGEELQTSGLVELLQELVGANPEAEELVKQILARARLRAVDWDRDDVTLVALTLEPVPDTDMDEMVEGSGAEGTRGQRFASWGRKN